MIEVVLITQIILFIIVISLLVLLIRRHLGDKTTNWEEKFISLEKSQEKIERTIKEEVYKNREESQSIARSTREEMTNNLKGFTDSFLLQMKEIAGLQKNQLESFSNQLSNLTQINTQKLDQIRDSIDKRLSSFQDAVSANSKQSREEISNSFQSFADSISNRMIEVSSSQKNQLDIFSNQLSTLINTNEQKFDKMRETIEGKLKSIQDDNSQKLDQMRAVVDEKLHATLEKRLGESFKQVSERLELVHKGLGEMQSLATGVGDLKKVLTNIKTRGSWGEVQLGNLLEQILTSEQYSKNVATKIGSGERVEYAIKLPGRGGKDIELVWLPIDAKFPQEDYHKLVDAQELANPILVEEAGKSLENRIKIEARKIKEKYIDPPHTTDFGIMFLPVESLYAEVLRRPGLCDTLQREFRVVVTGPTTLAALLNSLQMGFRTLAIEKRSSEVWQLLGAVKTEFGNFGDILDKTQKKLQEASNTIESAAKKSRTIQRKLKDVQQLPSTEAIDIIGEIEENQKEDMQ